jgi:hypothetical protein
MIEACRGGRGRGPRRADPGDAARLQARRLRPASSPITRSTRRLRRLQPRQLLRPARLSAAARAAGGRRREQPCGGRGATASCCCWSRLRIAVAAHDHAPPSAKRSAAALRTFVRWALIAAVPSGLMLSTTLHLTTDVAPMPLLWVVPLGLYLLSFTIAFAERRGAARFCTAAAPFRTAARRQHAVHPVGRPCCRWWC